MQSPRPRDFGYVVVVRDGLGTVSQLVWPIVGEAIESVHYGAGMALGRCGRLNTLDSSSPISNLVVITFSANMPEHSGKLLARDVDARGIEGGS